MDSKRKNNVNRQYVQQTVKEKLVYIQKNEQEPILFPYLQKLFVKKGFQNVQITHGNKEYGKDLVFCDIDKFNDKIWYGVIVKNKKASQNDFNIGGEIRNQIELAYRIPYKDNLSNEHHINRLLIIINASISDNATNIIGKMVEDHLKVNIKLWDQQKIEEEIEKHTKLEFLYGDNNITNNLEYNKLWIKVYEQFRLFPKDKKIQLNELQNIKSLKINNRFLKNTTIQNQILAELSRNDSFNNEIIQLITYAINDTGINIGYYPKIENKIKEGINENSLCEDIKLIIGRENTLTLNNDSIDNKSTSDAYIYENILRLLFKFEFNKAFKLIKEWKPQSTWIQKKAGLLYLIKPKEGINLLTTYINNEENIKEKYYSTQLLRMINENWSAYSTEIYESLNLDGLGDFISYYTDKISHIKNNTKPYGSFYIELHNNNLNKLYEYSLKSLQFLIESGALINYQYVTFVSADNWYNIFKNLYIHYPYPCLFYSIQCHNIDIEKRIGQDYAYAKELRCELVNIQHRLLKTYQSTNLPPYIKDGILRISKEMFIAIPSTSWEDIFIEIWDKNINILYDEKNTNNALWSFICGGIPFITNIEFINKILIFSLQHNTTNSRKSIDILSRLPKNIKKLINKESHIEINNLINNICNQDDYIIMYILKEILTNKSIKKISSRVDNINDSIYISKESIYALSYFAQHNSNQKKIKNIIISHSNLWNNGLNPNGSISNPMHIELSILNKYIKWDNSEIEQIFQILSIKYQELQEKYKQNIESNKIIDYTSILYEMNHFMQQHESILKNANNYSILKNNISNSYTHNRGYKNIEEALISNDQTIVHNGIVLLNNSIVTDGVNKHFSHIEFLISKIIFQKKEDLTFAIMILRNIIKNYHSKSFITNIQDKLIIILKQYDDTKCKELNLDLPICFSSFIKISDILKKYDYKSEYIDYWQKIKSDKWFITLLD